MPSTWASSLGTRDEDSLQISRRALFSKEELSRKADAEMQRRIEAGVQDNVEILQPDEPPAFDQQLVGKRIEVLWKNYEHGNDQPHMIWSSGRVVRVADGLTDKRSARARTVLPAAAVLWAWDADPEFEEEAGEQWLFLLPKKWNPKTHKAVYTLHSTAGATIRASWVACVRGRRVSVGSTCATLHTMVASWERAHMTFLMEFECFCRSEKNMCQTHDHMCLLAFPKGNQAYSNAP